MYRRKTKYYECPYCHANLDHGERCSCQEEASGRDELIDRMYRQDKNGQYTIRETATAV